MDIQLHKGDLPSLDQPAMQKLVSAEALAVDTETQGLYIPVHRLCVVQISCGDGICHLVQLGANDYNHATNLKQLLSNPNQLKLFHFARFDVGALNHWLGIKIKPIYCTKIASKLVRTYGASHGLSALVRELLGITLDKEQQTSDWARENLSESQKLYAAQDVLYLHRIRHHLDEMLVREGRKDLAEACFSFLPDRIAIDFIGMEHEDIFSH